MRAIGLSSITLATMALTATDVRSADNNWCATYTCGASPSSRAAKTASWACSASPLPSMGRPTNSAEIRNERSTRAGSPCGEWVRSVPVTKRQGPMSGGNVRFRGTADVREQLASVARV